MKLLPLVLVLSGCLTTGHAVLTEVKNTYNFDKPDDCTPPEILLADVLVGGMLTMGGIVERSPTVTGVGAVYLGLSTVITFAQMGACEWFD